MNLRSKKELAKRALKVGKDRIMFVASRLSDIKEALTKQDIRDLKQDGAIVIKDTRGRKKVVKVNNRSTGNIRKKVNTRKRDYVVMTRKLRRYVREMKIQGKVTHEEYKDIRKKIRNKAFKSKANLKEYIGGLNK
jgi:large subunit ribosomal protein L19e